MNCDCTFAYHSVIPPSHCPKCGRCLGCGQRDSAPWNPYPWFGPWPYTQPQPYWVTPNTTITYTTSTSGNQTL